MNSVLIHLQQKNNYAIQVVTTVREILGSDKICWLDFYIKDFSMIQV